MNRAALAAMIALSAGLAGCGGAHPATAADPGPGPGPAIAAAQPATRPAPATAPADPLAQLRSACQAAMAEILPHAEADQAIAVLPFLDDDGGVRCLGVLAGEEVQRLLLDAGRKVVDRQHVGLVLREKDLQLALQPSADQARRTGQLAGAEILLLGSLTQNGPQMLLSAKFLSVATGRPIAISRPQTIAMEPVKGLMWYVRRPGGETPLDLPPLSLRYEFICPGPRGETPLAEGSTVTSGQRFKIRVQANSDCWLYVLLYDSRGKASVLLPHREIAASNQIRGGASYEIPPGTTWYWFDEQAGSETFYLVASYGPLSDLDDLLKKMQQAGSQDQASSAAREQIEKVIVRGMSADTSADYRPKGVTVRSRGVGGVVDEGPAGTGLSTTGVDTVVTGHATAVKKVVLNHR